MRLLHIGTPQVRGQYCHKLLLPQIIERAQIKVETHESLRALDGELLPEVHLGVLRRDTAHGSISWYAQKGYEQHLAIDIL